MLLTSNQTKFRQALQNYTALEKYWDFERLTTNEPTRTEYSELSKNEQDMFCFFADVWAGEEPGEHRTKNDVRFNVTRARKNLNEADIDIINAWLDDPYWPMNDERGSVASYSNASPMQVWAMYPLS